MRFLKKSWILILIFTTLLSLNLSARMPFEVEPPIPLYHFEKPKRFVDPTFKEIFRSLCDYFQQEKYDKVIAESERLIQAYPEDSDILIVASFNKGLAIMMKRKYDPNIDYEQAIQAFQFAAANCPKSDIDYDNLLTHINYHIGASKQRQGKFKEAVKIYQSLLQKYPDTPIAEQAIVSVIRSFKEANEYDKAGAFLRSVIKKYPRKDFMPRVYLELALYYREKNNYSLAIENFQKIIDLFPNNRLATTAKKHIEYLSAGRYEAYLKRMKSIKEETAKLEEAKVTLKIEVKAKAQFNLGSTYFKQKKYARACKAFQEVIDLYPNSPWADDALYMMGECLLKQKKYQEAINVYQKVINEYPETNVLGKVLDGLFRAYSAQGKYEGALKTFEKYVLPEYQKLGKKEDIQAQFDTGDYYRFELNDHRGAIYAFQRFITKYPKDRLAAKAQYNIAECYKALKEDEKAIQAYQKVIDNYPQDVHASLAKRRIRAPEEAKKIEKININTASVSQLETLPHIGPQTAQAIVDYRQRRGPFKRIEDIMKVPSVGPKTFQGLRDRITVK